MKPRTMALSGKHSTITCSNKCDSRLNTRACRPRLDTLPSELVFAICAQLPDFQDSSPRVRLPRRANATLPQLARVAPNCFVPAVTTAVRRASWFCQVEPDLDSHFELARWEVKPDQQLEHQRLSGCIAVDVRGPRVVGPDGVAWPQVYLIVDGSLQQGIVPVDVIPFPVAAIRVMTLSSFPWLLDYPIPPCLVKLTIELAWDEPHAERIRLLAAHFPKTLRRLALKLYGIEPAESLVLARTLPPSVQDLDLVGMPLCDKGAGALVHALPTALQHLQIAASEMTQRGFLALIHHLPADQLVSLRLCGTVHSTESLDALAAWLHQTTCLETLQLPSAHNNAPLGAMVPVFAALPGTLRSLSLFGNVGAEAVAVMAPLPHLQVLNVMCVRDGTTIAPLIPHLPMTLREFRIAFVNLSTGELLEGLNAAHARGTRWPKLVKVTLQRVNLTWEQFETIMGALIRMNEKPEQCVEVHVPNESTLPSFPAVQKRWKAEGWNVLV
ncbi:hypothetical protein AMAG_10811 [Allomyces macrogynus ATCC 38327]|uniref:F-box domain-containing protein n=1 Tax=Allomyces macrogynus (strain ATCC 38327) TaxID=578462 RepID=A0A0L0SRH3_ALLM3|nr:hypothetical protein AMAG_10811 [Allomyces macrogynus ATCC 38327]|eukprot:KNE65158.1 hypothetical protein AMAG_10811 [Allomyces macrogynus ATCC 38327]